VKTFKLIAVISAVAVAVTCLARGDDASKNQSQTNNITNASVTFGGSLQEPVKSVLDRYLKIQAALADDSTNGISTNAVAISMAVKADKTKTLSSDVADGAEAVAKSKDLATVRENFKDLSHALIKYLADQHIHTGELDEAFCPMANAYWLQTNADIANPYLGHSMPGCGEIKRGF
jgi:Cu(I)/Ag(I) efflux system membrane fusion protein